MGSINARRDLPARRSFGAVLRLGAAMGLVATGVVQSGCAPPLLFADAGISLAEAGTSAFIEGELRSARKQPISRVAEAFTMALESLQFPVRNHNEEKGYVYIDAEKLNGDDIVIRLRLASPIVTTIQIRVGLLGDQAIARLVMEEADRFLSAAPPAAADPATNPTPDAIPALSAPPR